MIVYGTGPRALLKPTARGTQPTRLLVEAAFEAGAKQRLLTAVSAALGSGWTVRALFPSASGDAACPELARFFTVTATYPTAELYGVAQNGWDLARALETAGGDVSVVPDVAHSAYGQDGLAARRLAAGDLPGSEPHDWALVQMRCPSAWALDPPGDGARHGQGVLIGQPGTGFTSHREIAGMLDLDRDRDFVDDHEDARDPLSRDWPLDTPGHETGTASVLASRPPGLVLGAAPEATVVPLRAIRSVVNVFDSHVAQAVDYARRIGCSVISMSLGGGFFIGLEAAINCAVRNGVIVMAAAGNYSPWVVWPALYPACIAVAASNADCRPWQFSSHGPKVAISAPGESVWAAGYDLDSQPPRAVVHRSSGTSFSVAHLAGVAALWLAYHGRQRLLDRYGPTRLQAAFLHLLTTTGCTRPPGWNTSEFGAGIVDAAALLQAALPDADQLPAITAADVGPRHPIDLINQVCPDLSYDEVHARVTHLLGADEHMVRTYGPELLYLLTEHPEVRAAFIAGPKQTSTTRMAEIATTRNALTGVASHSLQAALLNRARINT